MRGTGENLALTREEYLVLKKAVVKTVDQAIVGRRVVPVDPVGNRGAEFYVYDRVTDPAAATVVARGDTILRDSVKLARTRAQILKLAKGFEITKEDMEASSGGRIKTINAQRCARMVAELENDLIWNSADEPDVDGLINDAGNTDAAVAAWNGGAGVAYPPEDVHAQAALLLADGFEGPYDLCLEAVNYGEAGFRQANSDRTELELIRAMPFVRNIYVDQHIPHGTMVNLQPGNEHAVLGQAYDVELEGGFYDPDKQVFKFNITTRTTIAVLQPNAVCTGTGL